MGHLRFLAGLHRCNMEVGGGEVKVWWSKWRGVGEIVDEEAGIIWAGVGSGYKQCLKEIKQRKLITQKGLTWWGRKKQAGENFLHVMAKIICDQLPTFSLKHPSGNDKDFVIAHITKNIDTNNVSSGQISTHVACVLLAPRPEEDSRL